MSFPTKKHARYRTNVMVRRMRLEITQEQFAKAMGVSRQTINAIERDRKKPSLYLALRMADYLHASVDQLFKFF